MSTLVYLDNVIKKYETEAGEFVALKNVNLKIEAGEFVAIIGKSGSGKSTLTNMFTGIDRPTSGKIEIAGTDISRLNEGEMASWRGRNLGIVFQFFQLLPTLTVIENVMLPMDFCQMYKPSEREKRALKLLAMVEIGSEQARKLPSQLSGGQQQRVAIARALANDPKLIAADEPTGNLDSKTASVIFELFAQLTKEGKTVVMVTHDRDLAKRVGRTLVLSDGEIIEEYLAESFPGLSDKQLAWMTKQLKKKRYAPGQVVLQKGEPVTKLWIVTKGAAEVVGEPSKGRQFVITELTRGKYFGEIELIRGEGSLATVRATSEGELEVVAVEREMFTKLLKESKSIKTKIEEEAESRYREHKQRVARKK